MNKLKAYINSFPRAQRRSVRQKIAEACDCTESCVRHWANGIRGIPAAQISNIVSACDGEIGALELLPGSEQVD